MIENYVYWSIWYTSLGKIKWIGLESLELCAIDYTLGHKYDRHPGFEPAPSSHKSSALPTELPGFPWTGQVSLEGTDHCNNKGTIGEGQSPDATSGHCSGLYL